MPISIAEQKRALRKEMMAKRDALSPIFRKQMSEKVAKVALPFDVPQGAIVSGYLSAPIERITAAGWHHLQKPVQMKDVALLISEGRPPLDAASS